jgi:hypothetical protein
MMAGTFTHWMIVEDALDKCRKMGHKGLNFNIILGKNHFVNLGAAGPDYPYLTDLLSGMIKIHTLADRMHYENTGEFLKVAATNLLKRKGEEFEICLSWLCGFISHVIADTIIHPMVNAIVGPYLFNSSEHLHCEMIQDSYIFQEIKGTELRYSEYVDLLKQCSDPKGDDGIHPALRSFWVEILEANHPGGEDKFDHIQPDDWHENFLSKIGGAEDPGPVFRHVREEKNLAYKRVSDITTYERRRFIENVRLPNGETGRFREDVFDKAVSKVIEIWGQLLVAIERQDINIFTSTVRNWNLDTGVDEDRIYFWDMKGEAQ